MSLTTKFATLNMQDEAPSNLSSIDMDQATHSQPPKRTPSKYKLSYVDINYQGRQIITVLRLDGDCVRCIRVASENSRSYASVVKTVRFTCSTNLDIFSKHDPFQDSRCSEELVLMDENKGATETHYWLEKHCPPLYSDRPDLYDKKDIEHPLYSAIMAKQGYDRTYNRVLLFGRSANGRGGGANGQCANSVIDTLSEQETAEVDSWFELASEPGSFPNNR